MSNAPLKKGFFGRRANAEVARLTKVVQDGNALLANNNLRTELPRMYKMVASMTAKARKQLQAALATAAKRDRQRVLKHGSNAQIRAMLG